MPELAAIASTPQAYLLARPTAPERRVGLVDLGSNTARLVVYAYQRGVSFRLIDAIREPVRLAAGMGEEGLLQPPAVKRTLDVLRLFADYAVATELASLKVLATSGLREATNREAVLAEIESLGLDFKVLSGEEEAELGVLAVANGLELCDAWVMDLGGGSVQLSRMHDRRFAGGASFPLGAVRLTERHLRSDPPTSDEVAALEATVAAELGGVLPGLAEHAQPLVAMGGSVRSLARLVQRRRAYPWPLLHGYELSRADLETVTELLLGRPRRRRARLSGLSADRADVIIAGALVFRWLLRASRRDRLLISGYGVREGALFRELLPPPHRLEDVRAFSVRNFFEHFPQPRRHTARVRFLARQLFHGLHQLHGLGDADLALLDAAATLHDVGTVVDYYRHHRHGAALLTSSPLNGFSHREQALISLLVRYHRGSAMPKLGPYRLLAAPGDPQRLRVLTCCLRLAEYLDRSRSGRIEDVRADVRRRRVRLHLHARDWPPLEVTETRKRAVFFEQVFARRLELLPEPL